jgi:hypothetical protein
MARTRTLLDRLVQAVKPATIVGFSPPVAPVDSDLWALTRTTIVRLSDDGLLVISPPPVECGGLESLDALGPVRHVVVSNAFHYLNARAFLERYPEARFWAAPGLFRRIAGLPAGTELAPDRRPPWSDAMDHAVLQATDEISEVALFHRESASLILTDLAFNMTSFARVVDRIGWRLNGAPIGFGHSRTARMLLLRDRDATKDFLERVLAWPFRRILVAHGDVVESDAIGVFRRAFDDHLR